MRLGGLHFPGQYRRVIGRCDGPVGVRACRGIGDDRFPTGAGDQLAADNDALALVDRDVVAVRVGVVASAARASGPAGLGVGGGGANVTMASAPNTVAAYWKRVGLRVFFMVIPSGRRGPRFGLRSSTWSNQEHRKGHFPPGYK